MKMDILVRLMNIQMELKGRIVIFKIRTHPLFNNSNLLRSPHSPRILSPSSFFLKTTDCSLIVILNDSQAVPVFESCHL